MKQHQKPSLDLTDYSSLLRIYNAAITEIISVQCESAPTTQDTSYWGDIFGDEHPYVARANSCQQHRLQCAKNQMAEARTRLLELLKDHVIEIDALYRKVGPDKYTGQIIIGKSGPQRFTRGGIVNCDKPSQMRSLGLLQLLDDYRKDPRILSNLEYSKRIVKGTESLEITYTSKYCDRHDYIVEGRELELLRATLVVDSIGTFTSGEAKHEIHNISIYGNYRESVGPQFNNQSLASSLYALDELVYLINTQSDLEIDLNAGPPDYLKIFEG